MVFTRRWFAKVITLSFFLLVSCLGTAYAGVQGALPLSTPIFHNGWEGDTAWNKVVAAYQGGELAQAEQLLLELAKGPNKEVALRNLAVVQKDRGKYDQAVQTYLGALQLAPADSALRRDLGWVLFDLGRFKEAEAEFRQALVFNPKDPWVFYGLGLSLARQRPSLGVPFLEKAVETDSTLAAAFFDLGLTYRELGETEKAATAFEGALDADRNYTVSHAFLAKIYEERGDLARAWSSYQRGVLARPRDTELKQNKARFMSIYEGFIRQMEQEAVVERQSVQPKVLEPISVPAAPFVRIGLVENIDMLRLAWSVPMEVKRGGRTVARLDPEGIWTLTRDGDVLSITSPDGSLVVSGAAPWQLVPTADTAATVVYDLVVSHGTFYARVEHRQYRGSMEVRTTSSGITLINIVSMAEYLASVVPSEMWSSMPLEALKAQAVAARTYTFRSMAGGRYKPRGFDVLGTPASSAYRGAGAENPRTTQAVLDTAGEVLVVDAGQLAETYYSSSAGGFSVSAAEAWRAGRSHLVAQIDSESSDAPQFPLGPRALEAWIKNVPSVFSSQSRYTSQSTFRWVKFVDADEMESRISTRKEVGRIQHIETKQRSKAGYVQEVEVIGTKGIYTIEGDAIRTVLGGLRSNLFKVEVERGSDGWPVRFVFFGGGFGHGVGMDQLGASGMAEQGYDMAAILHHYYGTAAVEQKY